MTTIAGLSTTGRVLKGPASDLVEVEDEEGLRHTAIQFHPALRAHPALTDALGVVKGFLESPMVTGLVELVGHDVEQGGFVYPTGPVWSVAEVVRLLADRGEPAGIRSGLELMYTVGQILVEGAEAGANQGVYSHGGLTPRRIVVKRDGQVLVIGYALPQVEILQFHEDQSQVPREDSFRYCPPERIEARPEDLTSDIFGLALVAFEFMTGKPVYDGLVNDIRQQAARGEGSRRLFRFREVLPDGVRELLTKALRPEPDARFLSGDEFLEDVHSLLANRSVPGRSLIDLMSDIRESGRRVGKALEAGRTLMMDKEEVQSSIEEPAGEQPDLSALGRSASAQWSPAKRRRAIPRRGAAPAPPEPLQAAAEPEPPQAAPAPVDEAPEPAAPPQRWSKVSRPAPRRPVRSAAAVTDRAAPAPSESVEVPAAVASAPPPPMVPPVEEETVPKPPARSAVVAPRTAEDLLARIRGSGSTPERAAEEEVPSDQTQAWPPAQVEVTIDASAPMSDQATVMMTPEQLRAKVAEQFQEEEVTDYAPPPVVEAPKTTKPSKSSQTVVLSVQVGHGREVKLTIDKKATAATAVARLAGEHLSIPTDLSGQLSGWFRLTIDGKAAKPGQAVSTLVEGVLAVESVANETRIVEIEVTGPDGNVRFSNPVGTAIPIGSIVDHLRGWLALPGSRWSLVLGDKTLSPHTILADEIGPGVVKLQLKPD